MLPVPGQQEIILGPISGQSVVLRQDVDLVDGGGGRLFLCGKSKLGFHCCCNFCKRQELIFGQCKYCIGFQSFSSVTIEYLGGWEQHSLAGKVLRGDILSHQRTTPPGWRTIKAQSSIILTSPSTFVRQHPDTRIPPSLHRQESRPPSSSSPPPTDLSHSQSQTSRHSFRPWALCLTT